MLSTASTDDLNFKSKPAPFPGIGKIVAASTAMPDAISVLPRDDCIEEANDPKPTGSGVFYVYKYQTCNGSSEIPDDHACAATDVENVGIVRHSQADCAWFNASAPAGFNMFGFDSADTLSFPNKYDAGTVPEPAELKVFNHEHYCSLNNVTFDRLCDGSYLAISARQGGHAKRIEGCEWPPTGTDTLECNRSYYGADTWYRKVTFYLQCTSDFCPQTRDAPGYPSGHGMAFW